MRYDFTITIGANTGTPEEAWLESVAYLAQKPGSMPEDYTKGEHRHKECPDCGEDMILGTGTLFDEYGNHIEVGMYGCCGCSHVLYC